VREGGAKCCFCVPGREREAICTFVLEGPEDFGVSKGAQKYTRERCCCEGGEKKKLGVMEILVLPKKAGREREAKKSLLIGREF